jgi:hypothetical protein
MSASKLDRSGVFGVKTQTHPEKQLSLSPSAVRIGKNGIEFRSAKSIPLFKEMSMAIQTPGDAKSVRFDGVVVACEGCRNEGYVVSLFCSHLPPQMQARMNVMASHNARL